MSTSTDDMINQLQATLAQGQQPTIFGIQAPPQPSALQTLLGLLKQQQYQAQANQRTPGPYGYLHDAGNLQFNQVGQGLGQAIGGAIPLIAQQKQDAQAANAAPDPNAPGPSGASGPPTPTSAAPPAPLTAQAAIGAAINKGKAVYAAQIGAGVDPDVAKLNTLKLMVSLGVPGADVQLGDAQSAVLKNQSTASDTAKNTGETQNYASLIQDRLLQQARDTAQFIPRPDLSSSEYMAQQDPNTGKIDYTKRGDKMPPPPLTPQADQARDVIAQKIANYDLQLSTAAGRGGPDMRQDLLTRAIAINPDFDEKNFKQSSDALKAFGPSGTQGQLMLKTQNAMNHLTALDQWGAALKNGDTQKANQIANYLSGQFGGIAAPTYAAVAPIVAGEVSGSLVKGGGGQEERQERVQALSGNLGDDARASAINGMRSLLGAQYKNNQNLYEQTTLRNDFTKRFPVDGGFPAPPGVTQTAPSGAQTAPPGWVLKADANGNRAYVSPDGKQFQEVK
jgi:hypothetical protein